MPDPLRLTIWLIAAWMVLGSPSSGAQAPPVAAPAESAPAVPVPVPVPVPVEPVESDSPGVAAILATAPRTPAEKVRAAKILTGFDRPDLAKRFLSEVLAANLDQDQLVSLHAQLGAPVFVELTGRPELAPEGKQLADAVLEAVRTVRQDTARLEGLVDGLSDADAVKRRAAMQGLLEGGKAALPVLIGALADPARAGQRDMIRAALVRFGMPAAAPLLAALESPDASLRGSAIQTLAGLPARQLMPFYLASTLDPDEDPQVRTMATRALATLGMAVPNRAEAAAMLLREARDYLAGRRNLPEDLDGNVTFWTWDVAAARPLAESRPLDDARLALAARLAAGAHRVAPADDQVRLFHLVTTLESAARKAGLGRPLAIEADSPAGIAAAAGLKTVEQVLLHALENDMPGAAIAAVQILGERGDMLGVLMGDPAGTPLVKAVRHGDARVRFAALEAIVRLDPRAPFPGSASVTDAAVFFASSQGRRAALVAGPSTAESQRIAGYLAAIGFVVETARSGRELIDLALRSADYELALVDMGLERPPVDLFLQQLRHDNRTARLPVGILARDGELVRAERAAERDGLAAAFPRPHSQEVVASQVGRTLVLAGQRVEASERLARAAKAMQWIADWSAGHEVFRLPRQIDPVYEALFHPELAEQATAILANSPTPEAQKALIDLASRSTQPLERRKAAVEALWDNVGKRGVLLTSSEILLQYDRYNQGENLDEASRHVLAAILNCLETPWKLSQQAKAPEQPPGAPQPEP